jgi:hypothetical protein
VYCELFDTLDFLDLDSDNAAKYESEQDEVEKVCDEISRNATIYIMTHDSKLSAPKENTKTVQTSHDKKGEESKSATPAVETSEKEGTSPIVTSDPTAVKSADKSSKTDSGDKAQSKVDYDMMH